MEEETCMVTYSIGSIIKETEIKVEKSHGESYTLNGDEAKISTFFQPFRLRVGSQKSLFSNCLSQDSY